MNRIYTRADFMNLPFEDRCTIIEGLLTDDYFEGQSEIDFWIAPTVDTEFGKRLLPTPPHIAKIEKAKFHYLVTKLTDKLFLDRETIEFDIENF
jgi:hypothetical protein